MDVAAFCDTCGAVFRTGAVVDDITDESFVGKSSGPCPVCGRKGYVPPAYPAFVGGVLEILTDPQRTEEELARLTAILSVACELRVGAEEIVAKLNSGAPEMAGIADLLPESGNRLYTYVSIVVALSSLLGRNRVDGNGATEMSVEQAIDHIFDEMDAVGKSLKPRLQSQLGRNDPCLCGSGKKYKRCCGQLA